MHELHIYLWNNAVNIGYLMPALDSWVKLADTIWEMRGEEDLE
jgi:hypothetical protein